MSPETSTKRRLLSESNEVSRMTKARRPDAGVTPNACGNIGRGERSIGRFSSEARDENRPEVFGRALVGYLIRHQCA